MRLHGLFASGKSCVRCFFSTNAKFEPCSVKRNFGRSTLTVCTTCAISLLPGIMKVTKTSTVEREYSKTRKNHHNLISKRLRKATWHNTLKLAKSSSSFGQRPLLTLIIDSLSSNFRGIFLLSSWFCVQSRKKH